jgi:hypothetical protein
LDDKAQAIVVRLISNGEAEKALELLAKHFGVTVPKFKVGLPKGRKRNSLGCYSPNSKTISVLNSDVVKNPFVILHEFYHHLRTSSVDLKHRGTERNADAFANDFVRAFRLFMFDDGDK